jgi:hypothetical protein
MTTVMNALEKRVPYIRSGLITGKFICPKPDDGLLELTNDNLMIQGVTQKCVTKALGEPPITPVLSKNMCQVSK